MAYHEWRRVLRSRPAQMASFRRLWPAAALVLVYLWVFPYFPALRSANELPRVLLTQEIVRHHTFRLDARLGELGSRFDIATTPDGHSFSNKAPGVSLLGVPVQWVLDAAGVTSTRASTWALRVLVVALPCLAFLWAFWRLTARFAGGGGSAEDAAAARRTALVALALGSMALPYAILFFSHALAGACAGGAFVAAVALVRGEARRPRWTALACGLLAGASMLVDYQSLLAAAAVGAYLLVRTPGPAAARLRTVALAALGAIPPVLLLLAYHAACFGSPWRTGYSFAADPAHQQGVLGIIGPNRVAMANALWAPDNGLVVLAPWVLLAILGGFAVARDREWRARAGAEALVCALVAVAYVLFVGSLVPEFGRAGWSVGPRYIGVAMPFLAWLAAAGLAWCNPRPAPRALAGALVVASVIVHVLAATTYPHWPTSFRHPLYEVSLRILREGLAPPSLGTALGLHGVWSILPAYVAAAALVVWALGVRPRARLLSTFAALVLGVALVAGYGGFRRSGPAGEKPWSFVRGTFSAPSP
jgi:hypothetical protein